MVDDGPGRRGRVVAPLLVALVAVAATAPCVGNGWVVDWDDGPNFAGNAANLGPGWARLRWAWTTRLLGVYQPVGWMILSAEVALLGLRPAAIHAASVAMHAADATIAYFLIRSLLDRFAGRPSSSSSSAPAIAAALWAASPLRAEAVAWASAQSYLPCAGLMMASTLAYLRADGGASRRRAWLGAATALYAAAGLSKAAAAGLPAALLAAELAKGPGDRRWRRAAMGLAPMAAVGVALSGLAIWARAEPAAGPGSFRRAGPVERIGRAAYGLSIYPAETAWPANLSAFDLAPEPFDPAESRFASAAIAALAGLSATALLARRRPAASAALIAYAAIVAPCLGLVSPVDLLAADRYAYASTIPLFALLAAGLDRATGPRRRWLVPLAVALTIASAPLCRDRCRAWRDSATLRGPVAPASRVF